MKISRGIYFVLIIILFGLIFLRPVLGPRILNFLERETKGSDNQRLIFENQNLRAEIAELKEMVARAPRERDEEYEFGFVYARYPFNVKSEVLINVGAKQSILKGNPVLFGAYETEEIGKSVLFGEVDGVFEETSLVKTIFGNDWRSEVRIGERGTLAVLEGGATPKLKLINKDAPILEGDVILNADERFPYGVAIGYVKNIGISGDHLFKEAELQIPYDLAEVGLVQVIK